MNNIFFVFVAKCSIANKCLNYLQIVFTANFEFIDSFFKLTRKFLHFLTNLFFLITEAICNFKTNAESLFGWCKNFWPSRARKNTKPVCKRLFLRFVYTAKKPISLLDFLRKFNVFTLKCDKDQRKFSFSLSINAPLLLSLFLKVSYT